MSIKSQLILLILASCIELYINLVLSLNCLPDKNPDWLLDIIFAKGFLNLWAITPDISLNATDKSNIGCQFLISLLPFGKHVIKHW